MKKIILVIAVIVLLLFLYMSTLGNYFFILKLNWGIKIPRGEIAYYTKTESSFLGDGTKYAVLKYTSDKKIANMLDWSDNKDEKIEDEILKNIAQLEIPKEYKINLQENYSHYSQTEIDSSKIYLIYIPEERRVYVIEDVR